MADVGRKDDYLYDISKDGTLTGPNLDQLAQINGAADCNIIASGGISSIEDIHVPEKTGTVWCHLRQIALSGNVVSERSIESGKGVSGNAG